jgi:hypothetical protein
MALHILKRRRLMAEDEKTIGTEVVEETELDIENRLRTKLQEEYDTRLEAQVQKISSEMQVENKKMVEAAIERFRKEMAPPSTQDIQTLLDQEYVEFKIEVKAGKGEDAKVKHFTISELPIAVEKKILKKVKLILVPFASELSAISLNLLQGDAAKKIVQIMNTFEPMLDVMVSVCTICLNPNDEDEEVTDEWVLKYVSATRIVKIVTAQMEANKMRDFFSLLFRNTKFMAQ